MLIFLFELNLILDYCILEEMGNIFGYCFLMIFFFDKNLGIFIFMMGEDDDELFCIFVSFYIVDLYNEEELWFNFILLCSFFWFFMVYFLKRCLCYFLSDVFLGWLIGDYIGMYYDEVFCDIIVIIENN